MKNLAVASISLSVKQFAVRVALILFLGMTLVACGSKSDSTTAEAQGQAQASGENSGSSEYEAMYNKSCISCHRMGMANAPRTGDTSEWQRRLNTKGMNVLVSNVRNGINAMPPMGMCNQCSDEDFEGLIHFMAEENKK